MAKTRVHQLAKELCIDSKLIMEEAEKHGISVKNHMSALDDSDEMMLRAFLEPLRAAPPPPMAPPEPPRVEHVEPTRAPRTEEHSSGMAVEKEPVRERDILPRTVTARHRDAGPPSPRQEGVPTLRHHESEPEPGSRSAAPLTSVHADPPRPSEPPREVRVIRVSRPGGPPAQTSPEATEPASEMSPAAKVRPAEGHSGDSHPPSPPPPPTIRVVPSATVVPPRANENPRPLREAAPPRRQAEIVGRRELPTPQRPPLRPPASGDDRRGSGFSARGSPSSPNSGLIVTKNEGGKRTFIVTGRGRGPAARPGGFGGGPGGPPRPGGTRPPNAVGGAFARDRGERPLRRPRESSPDIIAPSALTIEMPITMKGLAEAMGVKTQILIQKLFLNHRKMVKINESLDKETVEILGIEFNCDITCKERLDIETQMIVDIEKAHGEASGAAMVLRAPIVTFLGHVDHGKTSLLDAIRKTKVAAKEHGGITQHIGATRVELPDGRAVVFLDTPGHRAFTEMRSRGAQVTDVVVLVVAADDGVMPQTKEAIAHARAADVPIVIALNKIDKPEANALRVRQELAVDGLMDEKWGGKTIIVETSATTGRGIAELVESLCLESEILELKCNPNRPAIATVIEAEQSRGEGNVARLIINDGTLKKGDIFVCGTAQGRIRAIKGPDGNIILSAGPSMPVEITGLNELPRAGDKFYVLDDLEQAKEIATKRQHLLREKEIAKASHVSLENLFEKLKGATLKLILKVDVTGSLEVLQREIDALAHPEIRPEIIHAAVGGITETDVTLADASDAVILGFHVSADMGARRLAEQSGVEIRLYHVIYKLIEEMTAALEGKLKPEEKEVLTGEAEVRKIWKVSRLGTIAGCFVQSGVFKRSSKIRVSRGGIVVHNNGSLASLKRVKDDAREVKEGLECGMLINNFENIEPGDSITAYEIETVKRFFGS